jgi:hypothetical protein
MRAFNEADYLTLYPDVAASIRNGEFSDSWTHYKLFGRDENRAICIFDEEFYLRSYALAAREIAEGGAQGPFEHYLVRGRGRGYLPHAAAPRPRNPSGPASSCGGLWIDSADALDRVQGRYETGQITETQAMSLDQFVREGFVILRGGVSDEVGEAARADLERAYRGEIPGQMFECPALGLGPRPWGEITQGVQAKALDIHWFSPAIRKLIFAPAITEFLALIFENKSFASQTLGFLRGSGQSSHQDSAYVPYTCATSFAASWIALEDVTKDGGALFYYKGSHRLPEYWYDGEFKSVAEATRANSSNSIGPQIDEHVRSLDEKARLFGLERKRLMARQGDVLIWHADLVHGGEPVSRQSTRKSIVTHYCPKHLAPLFCEGRTLDFHDHSGHAFTSSLYSGEPPVQVPRPSAPNEVPPRQEGWKPPLEAELLLDRGFVQIIQ